MSGLLLVCATSLIAIMFMIYCYRKRSNLKKHHHDGHVQQEQELQTEVVYDVPVFPDQKNQDDNHQNSAHAMDGEVIVHQNVAYELIVHTTSAGDNMVCAPLSTFVKNQGQLQNNISDEEMNIHQNVAYEVFPIN